MLSRIKLDPTIVATVFILPTLLLWSFCVDAMRCGTHIISKGDLALEVEQHCGKPDWVDRWYEEIVLAEETDFERRFSKKIERWIYNFGPKQFMRFVTIHNNHVVNIITGDYGFEIPDSTLGCDSNTFSLGMTSMEVQTKCGLPDGKTRTNETLTRPLAQSARQKVTIAIDEWVYNLGPQSLIRVLTFRNGKLIKIETDGKGF